MQTTNTQTVRGDASAENTSRLSESGKDSKIQSIPSEAAGTVPDLLHLRCTAALPRLTKKEGQSLWVQELRADSRQKQGEYNSRNAKSIAWKGFRSSGFDLGQLVLQAQSEIASW